MEKVCLQGASSLDKRDANWNLPRQTLQSLLILILIILQVHDGSDYEFPYAGLKSDRVDPRRAELMDAIRQ